jgi:hypothetical protein
MAGSDDGFAIIRFKRMRHLLKRVEVEAVFVVSVKLSPHEGRLLLWCCETTCFEGCYDTVRVSEGSVSSWVEFRQIGLGCRWVLVVCQFSVTRYL